MRGGSEGREVVGREKGEGGSVGRERGEGGSGGVKGRTRLQFFQHCVHTPLKVRALVVLPSQELGAQVCRVFEQVAQGTGVHIGMICGHQSVERESEMLTDSSSYPPSSTVDVVIATPGRLVDHLDRFSFVTLRYLRFLVLDEADKLLSHQFQQWTSKLWDAVSQDRERSHHGELSLEETLHGLCTSSSLLHMLHASPRSQVRTCDYQLASLILGAFLYITCNIQALSESVDVHFTAS